MKMNQFLKDFILMLFCQGSNLWMTSGLIDEGAVFHHINKKMTMYGL